MRFSEFVHTNLDGPFRHMFRSTNVSSLVDVVIEHSTRCLLTSKQLKEEAINGISTTKFENVKKEFVDYGKSLESSLEANMTLTNQIKELLDVHSHCEIEKKSLKDEIAGLTAERLSLQVEIRKLKGGLTDLFATKQVDAEKINQLEKDLDEAQNFVVEQ